MINLRKITWDNYRDCIRLKVKEEQEDFVASNMFSLAQAYVALLNDEFPPMAYAICLNDQVIGFLMMYYDTAEESDYAEASYGIARFMIDRELQGKGYGKAAFAKALELIRTFPQGSAVSVYISYEPKNKIARKLYASFGFVETGAMAGDEVVARLSLC